MKFKQLLEGILLEANTKDILMNKAGLNEYNADLLTNTFGKLAIKIFKKILEGSIKLNTENPNVYRLSGVANYGGKTMRDKIIQYFNDRRSAIIDYFGGRTEMNSLRDYIRVGLNNNYTQIENLTIPEMLKKAEEWHESMGTGDSEVNYVEDKPIILDFREDGSGFYWVDLEKTSCSKEAERMGHCASSAGRLYSLRSYKKIDDDHTFNKSHLTASIDGNGKLLQLKGPKNSKPSQELHQFILPLLYFKDGYGEYLINGFGYEYKKENDFQIGDLNENQIKTLYEQRPELFSGRAEKKLLYSLGLLVRPERDSVFTLSMRPKDIDDYVDGGWIVRRGTTKDGRTYSSDIFEIILEGDIWDIYDNYEADWKGAITYYLDKENTQKIQTILMKLAQERGEEIDFSQDLSDLIDEYDENYDISSAISGSVNDAERDSYHNYLYRQLKDCLEEYGKVIKIDDTGVEIEIDLDKHIGDVDEEAIDDAYEACDDSVSCVFAELLSENWIEKPKFHIDDRWYPDVDENNFNSILNDRLNEI